MNPTVRSQAVVTVALALCVVGCGTSTRPTVEPDHANVAPRYLSRDEYAASHAKQRALLADGEVTRAEYEFAARRYVRCLTAHGLEVRELGWDPISNQQLEIQYRGIDMAQQEANSLGEECLTANLANASEQYRADSTPVMTTNLLELTRHCLTDKNVGTTGRERSLPDLFDSTPDKHREVTDCVIAAMERLYPDIPATIGR